ncbi:hypothetical protein TWF696_006180 [Orbilia brochopaga]|uniref:Uncharacterized protein n=1 Tax=Orbilia brochopaga TaxID=3140254 RepID=A0AAV9UVE9_9PEZI
MKLLVVTLIATVLPEALAAPPLDKRGGPFLRNAPAYDPSRKRDFTHLDEIGVPFPLLVRHINEKYPDHKLIAERKFDPESNRTLHRLDIPDDMWHDAVTTYPHHKREEHLARRSLLPPPNSQQGPADSLSRRSVAFSGYKEIRECGAPTVEVNNDRYMDAVNYFCRTFDDELKLKMDVSSPDPPPNIEIGPWMTGTDSGHDVPGADGNVVKGCDWYFNFVRSPSFPWDKVFLLCRAQLASLKSCDSATTTSGGKSGFNSKLAEGMVAWLMAPDPAFTQKQFVVG